jgi:hypothetical protein
VSEPDGAGAPTRTFRTASASRPTRSRSASYEVAPFGIEFPDIVAVAAQQHGKRLARIGRARDGAPADDEIEPQE